MVEYWRERFPLWMFGPIAGLLASLGTADPGSRRSWTLDTLVALGLLAQFRLWDDLTDRAHDRIHHPARVLSRAGDVTNFEVLCAALGLANLLVAAVRGPDFTALVVLLTLDVALGVWYAHRRGRSAAGDLLILAKYPAFVLVIVAGGPLDVAALAPALAATYLAACAVELIHDPDSPLRAGAAR